MSKMFQNQALGQVHQLVLQHVLQHSLCSTNLFLCSRVASATHLLSLQLVNDVCFGYGIEVSYSKHSSYHEKRMNSLVLLNPSYVIHSFGFLFKLCRWIVSVLGMRLKLFTQSISSCPEYKMSFLMVLLDPSYFVYYPYSLFKLYRSIRSY